MGGAEQVPPPATNGAAAAEIELIVSAALPVLLSVTLRAPPSPPAGTPPQFRFGGVIASAGTAAGGTAVPLSAKLAGPDDALLPMSIVELNVPAAAALKS